MFSNLVPFESVVERVKDDTGMTIAKNQYPKIRRLLYRAEHDLGYGGTVILKRVKYSLTDGTMLYDGNIYKLKLPDDIVHLEKLGSCNENSIHPSQWRLQGNWMFFCNGVRPEEFTLFYYTLLHDGNGNPVTTENHFEAVTSGIVYWMFKQGVFTGKRNANLLMYYENYYHDRLGEARGSDVFPSTDEEWKRIAEKLRWSYKDALIYSDKEQCFCEVPESFLTTSIDAGGTTGGGSGYTDPAVTVPGGGSAGTGSGGIVEPVYVAPDPAPDPDNQPPTIGNIQMTVLGGTTTPITLAAFTTLAAPPYNDPEGDLFDAVRFNWINPLNTGAWYLNYVPVVANTVVTRVQLNNNELVHVGVAPEPGSPDKNDTFLFSVRDEVNQTWVD